jgi:hypothetical protein
MALALRPGAVGRWEVVGIAALHPPYDVEASGIRSTPLRTPRVAAEWRVAGRAV